MPGLVPGIHVLTCFHGGDVDGRVKPGHDEVIWVGRRQKHPISVAKSPAAGRFAALRGDSGLARNPVEGYIARVRAALDRIEAVRAGRLGSIPAVIGGQARLEVFEVELFD